MMTNGKPVPGPYTQQSRETWLTKLLSAQNYIRNKGPTEVRGIELISLEELQEIRRIWVVDKHELEDSLPRIYRETTGEKYPGRPLDDNLVLGEMEMRALEEICGGDRLHYELTRELLSLTRQQRTTARRAGLFEQMEKSFARHYYDDREDALSRAQRIADERKRREDAIKCRTTGYIAEGAAGLEIEE
jgi:DNA sulfur modification protein DndC